MRHARSAGVAFAGGEIIDGMGKSFDPRNVVEGSVGGGIPLNDPRFSAQC